IAHTPAPAAPTATPDTLQQCLAFAGHTRPVSIVSVEVFCEPPLVRHELLPADVARIGVLQAHRPVLQRYRPRAGTTRARAAAERGSAATAVDIRSRIGRVLQGLQHPRTARRPPDHLMRCGPAQ